MTRVISYGSSGILARARVVVVAKRICLIVLYKAKMAKYKTENCHKRPKNGLNDIQFGHNMYYDDFNRFQKNWRKMLIFWPKIGFFLICGPNFSLAVFGGKFMRFQENGPICLIFYINVYWSTYHNN